MGGPLLTSTPARDPFVVRNVGNVVPPFEIGGGWPRRLGRHEFATVVLEVKTSWSAATCGAIRALSKPQREDAPHLRWFN